MSATTKLADIILLLKRYLSGSTLRADFDIIFPKLWFESARFLQSEFPVVTCLLEQLADIAVAIDPHFSAEQHRNIVAKLFRDFVHRCAVIGIAL